MNNKKLMGRSTDGGPSTGSGRGRGPRSGNRPPGTVNQDFRPDDRISRMYRILAGGKSAAPLPIPNFFLCSCTFPVFLLGSRGERFQYPISNVQGDRAGKKKTNSQFNHGWTRMDTARRSRNQRSGATKNTRNHKKGSLKWKSTSFAI